MISQEPLGLTSLGSYLLNAQGSCGLDVLRGTIVALQPAEFGPTYGRAERELVYPFACKLDN